MPLAICSLALYLSISPSSPPYVCPSASLPHLPFTVLLSVQFAHFSVSPFQCVCLFYFSFPISPPHVPPSPPHCLSFYISLSITLSLSCSLCIFYLTANSRKTQTFRFEGWVSFSPSKCVGRGRGRGIETLLWKYIWRKRRTERGWRELRRIGGGSAVNTLIVSWLCRQEW
jgi:hypothetical protein